MIEEREVQFGFTGWHFEQPKQSARLACEAEASHKRISMGIATDPRRTFRCHDGAAFSVTRRRCAGNTAHRARLHPAALLGGQHLGGRRRAAWLSPHRARRHLPPAMHGRREGQATGATAATYMDLLKTDPSLEQRAIDQPVEPARLMTEIGAPCQLAAPAGTRPTGCGPRAFRRQTSIVAIANLCLHAALRPHFRSCMGGNTTAGRFCGRHDWITMIRYRRDARGGRAGRRLAPESGFGRFARDVICSRHAVTHAANADAGNLALEMIESPIPSRLHAIDSRLDGGVQSLGALVPNCPAPQSRARSWRNITRSSVPNSRPPRSVRIAISSPGIPPARSRPRLINVMILKCHGISP